MLIKKLELVSFGKFKDLEIQFDEGLNVIYGANESGKSTIQGFILGMLYGFTDPSSPNRRKYTPEQQRFTPWLGDRYYGVMEYTLEGNHYRIERNFDANNGRVVVFKNGQDVTESYIQNKRKEREFALEHLGISSRVFKNTVWIGQLSSRTEDSLIDEIKTKLVNLKYSGAEDLSIGKAKSAIEKELEDIGSERAAKKKLGASIVAIGGIEAKIQNEQQQRQRLENLQQGIFHNKQRISYLTSLKAKLKLEEIHKYQKEIIRLQERLGSFKPIEGVDYSQGARVLELRTKINIFEEEVSNLESQKKILIAQSEEYELKIEPLRGYSIASEEELIKLEVLIREQQASSDNIRALEESISELRGKDSINIKNRGKLTYLYPLGIAGVILGLILSNNSPGFVGLAIISGLLILWALLQHKRQRGNIKEIQSLNLQLNNLNGSLSREIEKRNKIEGEIKGIISKFASTMKDIDIQKSIQTLKDNFKKYTILTGEMDRLIKDIVSVEEKIEEKLRSVQHCTNQFASISGGYFDTIDQYLSYCDRHQGYLERVALEEKISQLAGDGGVAGLEKQVVEGQKYGEKTQIKLGQSDVDRQIEEISKEIIRAEEEVRLMGNREWDLAYLYEALEVEQAKKHRLLKRKKALETAFDKIVEVSSRVQRDFTPILNKYISDSVFRISKGKYNKVVVNEGLNIMVEDPFVKQLKSIDYLSRGTIDQVYLAFRLGLANLISKDMKLPIILDDSFVQYDDGRLKEALGYLEEFSPQHQVILFTCQRREREALENSKIDYNYIAL